MENFNLKKFLVENKLTTNSRTLTEEAGDTAAVDTAILKALEMEPKEQSEGERTVYSYEVSGEYTLYIETSPEMDKEDGLECKLEMYFYDMYEDEENPNTELLELDGVNLKINKSIDTKYPTYFTGMDNVDITNKLSEETLSKLVNTLSELANKSLEMYVDNADNYDSMSDQEFHAWANPSLR
jgi:hypothetical protein